MEKSNLTIRSGDFSFTFSLGPQGVACVAETWMGEPCEGRLLDFDQEGRTVSVLPVGVQQPCRLLLKDLRLLRIAAGLGVDPADDDTSLGSVADESNDFRVLFQDGRVLTGQARHWSERPDGLWLFLSRTRPQYPAAVFIPAAGMRSVQFQSGSSPLPVPPSSRQQLRRKIDVEAPVPTPMQAPGSREALGAALDAQLRHRLIPIGEALLALGKITSEQLTQALALQTRSPGVPLGQVLLEMKMVSTGDLQTALVTKMGYPFVDLRQFPLDATALRKVQPALALRLKVLPLMEWKSCLVVAMSDPLQFRVIDELEFSCECKVRPVVTTASDLEGQIAKAYRSIGFGASPAPAAASRGPAQESPESGGHNAQLLAAELAGGDTRVQEEEKPLEQSDNTLVRLINSMIREAYYQRASDIHIEPYPGRERVSIRFRIDGELRPYLELPPSYRNALTARIKIMCDLDISERRKPQDGKIDFSRYGGLPLELRVATIPTTNGLEDIVMRLLTSAKVVALDSLNLSSSNLAALQKILERPYGLFLCVGPTGSGKTTTLHSALQRLNRPNRKIWTAEDPVEITQHGLRQIQVNSRIGWTFAAALRSLLRADPDVIMLGEIRDPETAEIAIEASLTGHLVLSTLHTNSAAETIVRLNDLGVDSFSFADSLQGIVAQRLVRRFCPSCTSSHPMSDARLDAIIDDFQRVLPPGHGVRSHAALHAEWLGRHGRDGTLLEYHASGCEQCGHTGYLGRLALHELLVASAGIRQLVQQRARPAEIRDLAIAEGMRTLRQDGIEKVLAGLTSLAEVRSATGD